MNPFTKQNQTRGLREQACGCQREEGGSGMEGEFGVSKCKV